ncbi:DUF4375 domain-containing protein [Fulvivirga sp.]|uniref:DMP19 family protein n=1 Tax=Fulvivirga sp. TaxID=1931237 RepID=UPI0032EE9FEF
MATIKHSKIIITITILVFCGNPVDSRNESANSKSNMTVFSLDDGNQCTLIYSIKIKQEWLDSLKVKYVWNDFDEYDNRLWEHMYTLFDPMVENSGAKNSNELWQNLTRGQKLFWSFLAFNGDTDNGGVYQFFSNRPEHAVSVLEVWHELNIDRLEKDYKATLEELVGKTDKISEFRTKFNEQDSDWNERWEAFNEGYKELPSAEAIEEYYYDKEFKRTLFKALTDYIENNIEQFALVTDN